MTTLYAHALNPLFTEHGSNIFHSKTFTINSAFFKAAARLLVTSTSLTKKVYGVASSSLFLTNALQINCKFSVVILRGKSIGDSKSSPLSDLNCARTWPTSSFSSDSDNFLLEILRKIIYLIYKWRRFQLCSSSHYKKLLHISLLDSTYILSIFNSDTCLTVSTWRHLALISWTPMSVMM